MGMGPMTGRAAGYCAGYPVPGFMNPFGGRGALGGGWGRGRRNWYGATGLPGWCRASVGLPAWGSPGFVPPMAPTATASKEQELAFLKGQAEYMETALGDIRKRLAELEREAAK